MPYIGNDVQFGELTSQTFTGDGSTTAFTLAYTVANPTSLIVTIANVIQEPTTAYTVAGTTLTCTSAPADDDTIHVRYLGRVVDVANAAILQDSDQDTKIQVEESSDEDTIRFDIAGAEDFTMTANDFTALSGSTISTNTIAETTADTGVTIDGLLVKDGDISATSELTVNEAGADVDFRIESDTNTNAFDLDGGLHGGVGAVGIGRNAENTVDVLIGNPAITAAADQNHYRLRIVPAGAVTIPSGTAAEVATLSVFEPNITATGTVTTAASLWVHSAPTEATNNFALYVDAGASKFDGSVTAAGPLFIGDTANAGNTVGLTINQAATDNEIISLKSSDVAHGLTSISETDSFMTFKKGIAATGGGGVCFIHENAIASNPHYMQFFGGTAQTTKSTSEYGLFWQDVHEHDGSNGIDNITANGNCYSWHGQIGGTANRTIMILDEDGDLHVDGSTSLSAFDAWDDAALLRSLELWREGETEGKLSDQMLKSRYDANKYTKEQLELTKLIQVVPDKDWAPTGPDAQQALVNTGALGRITTGAVWQNHEMLDAIIETMEERDSGFTAALKKKFVARGLPTQILDWTADIPDDLVKPDTAPKAFNAD